jgi:hypothetical protein
VEHVRDDPVRCALDGACAFKLLFEQRLKGRERTEGEGPALVVLRRPEPHLARVEVDLRLT